MKKWLIGLVLLPNLALGATVDLSWTNATQNTDGSNIVTSGEGALVNTTLYWSVCDPQDQVIITPGLDKIVPTTIPGNAESTTVDIGTPGRWCFTAVHSNNLGEVSDYSGVAVKDVIVIPDPPTGLTVGPDNLYVYYISQSKDVVVLVPVGTISVGTECDGTMTVNQHYRVPVDDVTWIGSARPPVVFALCQ